MAMSYVTNRKTPWKGLLSVLTGVTLTAGVVVSAQAGTVTSEAELRSAIGSGDANIVIPANTTIKLTASLPAITSGTTISGATNGTSIIDGSGLYAGFAVNAGVTAEFNGITIQNTKLTADYTRSDNSTIGGAAIFSKGNVTVDSCHFENNIVDVTGANDVGAVGGAIYSTKSGNITVQYSSFFSNQALGAAGRVVAEGNLVSTTASGGAINVDGIGNIHNSTFYGNQARGGDGIGKNPKLASCAGAHAYGGAICAGSSSTVTINFLTMSSNTAYGGDTEMSSAGGISYGGNGYGGAISTGNGNVSIKNTIFTGSVEHSGEIKAAAGYAPDVDGSFTNAGGNLFAAASTVVEAMEVEKNGTKVLPITKASPAYNQALTDAATRDQRTMKRPRTNKGTGTGYDIGAYQLGEWTVIGIGTDRPYYTDNILSYRVLDPYGTDVTATVTGKPTLTTPATIASPVGTDYPVVPSLGTLDPSKDYIYINGEFDIYAVPLTITVDATKVYDGTPLVSSYIVATATGLVGSDSLTAGVFTSGDSVVGTYVYPTSSSITTPFATAYGISNYTVTYVATQKITAAPLTIEVTEAKVYDGTPLISPYTIAKVTGLASGDSLTAGAFTSASANIGSYTYPTSSMISTPFATVKGIGNYTVTYIANQTITAAPLTITITDAKTYDGTPLTSSYTIATTSGLMPGDALTAGAATTTSANVGNYSYPVSSTITTPFNTTYGINNYIVTYVINQKINVAPLTINVVDTKVYDGTPLVSDYTKATATGLIAGDYLTAGAFTTTGSDIGTYTYPTTSTMTTPFNTSMGINNYSVTYTATQDITPAALVITVNDTKVYDGTPLTSSYAKATVTGLMPGDYLTAGAFTTASANVGSYTYPATSTISTPFNTAMGISNYTVIYNANQAITAAPLTITLKDTKVYDGTTLTSSYTKATATGLVSGDYLTAGAATTASANIGTYDYPASSSISTPFDTAKGIANYTVTYVISQSITPAPLTITLNDTKVYDGTPLVSSYIKATATGLIAGDSLTAGAATTSSANVGTYTYPASSAITTPFATAMGINNYTVTYIINQSITAAPLTITVTDNKVYDGTTLTSDYTKASATGLIAGDTLTAGAFTTTKADIGTYKYPATSTITTPFATAMGISNYTVTYVATQDITPAGLVITINDTKVYDGTPLVSSYTKATVTGLMSGDSLTAGAATSTGSDVGSYSYPTTSTITTPFATAYGIDNYTVTYIINQTITPAPLTITINDTKAYDGTALTSSYTKATATGLMAGDRLTAGAATTAGSDIGTYNYPATSTISTPFDTAKGISNYTVTYVITQTITPAPLTITINDTKVYDGATLTSSYTIATTSGLMAGDYLTSGAATTASANVGSYSYPASSNITTPFNTAKGISNYTVTYVINQSITKAPLTITINDTKVYDGTALTSSYTIAAATGLIAGDSLTAGAATTTKADIGTYTYPATSTITTPFDTAKGIANYTVTYVINQDITPAGLVITINDTKVYDGTPLVSSYTKATVTGLMSGDSLTAGAATSTSAAVGSYSYPTTSTITTPFNTAKGISNYTVTYIINQTITPAPLTITINDTKAYDGTTLTSSYTKATATGLMSGDRLTAGAATTSSADIGTYNYPATSVISTPFDTAKGISNYTVTYVITQNITPAPLTITINDTKVYDGTPLTSSYMIATASGLISGDYLTAGTATTSSAKVGSYTYPASSSISTPFNTSLGISNYTVTYVINQKITAAPLVITINDQKIYDSTVLVSPYTIATTTGLIAGDYLTAGAATTSKADIGTYSYPKTSTITTAFATAMGIENYSVSYVIDQKITALEMAVGLPGAERYYGEMNYEAIDDMTHAQYGKKTVWDKTDLWFYYNGKWEPYSTFADYFTGTPTFKCAAKDRVAPVGNYDVMVYWGSFRGNNVKITNAVSDTVLTHNANNSAQAYSAVLGDYYRVLPVDLYITAYTDEPIGLSKIKSLIACQDETIIQNSLGLKYYYGRTNEVTGKLEGYFVNGENESVLISKPRTRLKNRFQELGLGTYEITPYGAQADNYNIIRWNGTLAIFNDIWCLEDGPLPKNYEVTGLFEQLVLVKNDSGYNWEGIQLFASNVKGGTIVNATSTTKAGYMIQHNYPVVNGEVVAFVLEYQIKSGNGLKDYPDFSFTPIVAGVNDDQIQVRIPATGTVKYADQTPSTIIYPYIMDVKTYGPSNGYDMEDWTFDLNGEGHPEDWIGLRYREKYGWAAWVNVGFVLEINGTTKGAVYEIQFSDSVTGPWTPVVPQITATGTTTYWVDKGAPKTSSHPVVDGKATNRYYRVVQVK